MDVFTNIAFICLQKRNEPVSESIPFYNIPNSLMSAF